MNSKIVKYSNSTYILRLSKCHMIIKNGMSRAGDFCGTSFSEFQCLKDDGTLKVLKLLNMF